MVSRVWNEELLGKEERDELSRNVTPRLLNTYTDPCQRAQRNRVPVQGKNDRPIVISNEDLCVCLLFLFWVREERERECIIPESRSLCLQFIGSPFFRFLQSPNDRKKKGNMRSILIRRTNSYLQNWKQTLISGSR
jgi:hypothetical protein